jgi:hypothetical protein
VSVGISRFGHNRRKPPDIIRFSAQKVRDRAIGLENFPQKTSLASVTLLKMTTFPQALVVGKKGDQIPCGDVLSGDPAAEGRGMIGVGARQGGKHTGCGPA